MALFGQQKAPDGTGAFKTYGKYCYSILFFKRLAMLSNSSNEW